MFTDINVHVTVIIATWIISLYVDLGSITISALGYRNRCFVS